MTTTQTPREIDTKLAAVWAEIAKAEQLVGYSASALRSLAGATYYYRGRQRVTDMSLEQAVELVREAAAYVEAYKASHKIVEADGWERTDWSAYGHQTVATYDADKPAEELEKLERRTMALEGLQLQAAALEDQYRGWNRFFLVTSSAGHVHASRSCSTCRPTTTYGWLPELSGKGEAEAVAELGPTLCSVCFPSAPTEWTAGRKMTAAQAAKRAA